MMAFHDTPARVYIDGILVQWAERWEWGDARMRRPKRSKTAGGRVIVQAPSSHLQMTPQVARDKLESFVRSRPQVMVKISGGGRGLKAIMRHVTYISRHGDVELEDENGERHGGPADNRGKLALADVEEMLGHGGRPIPQESDKREAINIVLSMPAGTDRRSVHEAARDFARETFGQNYQYVMANHDDEPHPHVHLMVKVRGLDGTNLNPRKVDLLEWREGFVRSLRAHGIDAVTTRRRTRLQREKGAPIGVTKMGERGEPLTYTNRSEANAWAAARQGRDNAAALIESLRVVAEALARGDPKDRELSLAVVERLNALQHGPSKDVASDRGRPARKQAPSRSARRPEVER